MKRKFLTDNQLDALFQRAAKKTICTESYKKAWMLMKARLDKHGLTSKNTGNKNTH